MRYIFFCIYNTQYLDGKNKTNNTPWLNAVCMMLGGSFCCMSIIFEIYYFYILNKNFPLNSITFDMSIGLLIFLHYFFLIKDESYNAIYDRYKDSGYNNRKTNVMVSLAFTFIPTFIAMVIAMKWHKVI
ncbi:MAG: hypothetical protein ACXVAY_12740 [Mucilaginibacter sp.]